MLRKAYFILLITGYLVVTTGCNNYSKILKSPDNTLKYQTGVDLYENGNFKKALQFFDMLRTFYQGTKKGEKLTYYTANPDKGLSVGQLLFSSISADVSQRETC